MLQKLQWFIINNYYVHDWLNGCGLQKSRSNLLTTDYVKVKRLRVLYFNLGYIFLSGTK